MSGKTETKEENYKKGKGVERVVRPNHPLCWMCNRKFRGNYFVERAIAGHMRQLHKACAEESDEQAKQPVVWG